RYGRLASAAEAPQEGALRRHRRGGRLVVESLKGTREPGRVVARLDRQGALSDRRNHLVEVQHGPFDVGAEPAQAGERQDDGVVIAALQPGDARVDVPPEIPDRKVRTHGADLADPPRPPGSADATPPAPPERRRSLSPSACQRARRLARLPMTTVVTPGTGPRLPGPRRRRRPVRRQDRAALPRPRGPGSRRARALHAGSRVDRLPRPRRP